MQEEKEKAQLSNDDEGRKSHERTSTSTPRRSNSESSTEGKDFFYIIYIFHCTN